MTHSAFNCLSMIFKDYSCQVLLLLANEKKPKHTQFKAIPDPCTLSWLLQLGSSTFFCSAIHLKLFNPTAENPTTIAHLLPNTY